MITNTFNGGGKEKYFGLSPRIAKWKIDNKFENWLSYKADYSQLWKKIYVIYYRIFDHIYYKNGLTYIEKFLENHNFSNNVYKTNDIIIDMIYCLHRYGISFQDYCIYDFPNQNLENRINFVSDKLRYYYYDILNNDSILKLLNNKYECYKTFEKYYKRDVIGCQSINDFDKFESFISKHGNFIFKPLSEHSGHGVEIINTNAIEPRIFFEKKLKNGAFVLEELICQGIETSKMNPSSINTIRVVTFKSNNVVHIISATWRIGSGGAIVDNASAGGMFVAVNLEDGQIETNAITYSGKEFTHHPDSGIKFVGYQLPKWQEAKNLVCEIAKVVDDAILISWDICYSNMGWMMVEGNATGEWSLVQANHKIGKKHILFKLMDEYFKTKR